MKLLRHPPLPSVGVGIDGRGPTARAEILRELVRKIAGTDPLHRFFEIVVHSYELDRRSVLAQLQHDVAGAGITVLRSSHGAGVHEVNPVDFSLPRLVSVTEADHIAGLRSSLLGHVEAEAV